MRLRDSGIGLQNKSVRVEFLKITRGVYLELEGTWKAVKKSVHMGKLKHVFYIYKFYKSKPFVCFLTFLLILT